MSAGGYAEAVGVAEAVDEFEREVLAANSALAVLYEEAASAGEVRMRELSPRIAFPAWPGATSATALRRVALEAEIAAILDAYAAAARELIRPADVERWQALVHEARRRRGDGVLADELGRSTVGASLLRDRLGHRPQPRQQRGSADCACGYARDGVLPERLCPECGDVLVRRWVAEERRLLRDMPEYAADVTEIIEETARKQTLAMTTPGEFNASDAEGRRRAGGRRLARLRRRRGAEATSPDLTRWHNFREPLSRDAREGVRKSAASAAKRGLGAAAMTELAVRGSGELVQSAARFQSARANRRR